jgi:hypothetical protein
MIEVEKLNVSKQKILSTIRLKGPSLPVQIAREINFSPLFASAFLSELKGEGQIKLSNMRVGSSPLYYLPGQEDMLEKFVPYLNQREKEAFQLLKKNLVLEDSEQSPVMRVALRAIKDFAVPVKARVNGESKLYWKHHSLTDEEVSERIDSMGGKQVRSVEKKEDFVAEDVSVGRVSGKVETAPHQKLDNEKSEVGGSESKVPARPPESVSERADSGKGEGEAVEKKDVQRGLDGEERPLAEKKKARDADNGFPILVKDFLSRKDIEILHVVAEKKKEFEAKIRIGTDLGKQNYYLIAKDKKSATDNDLTKAEKKARGEKLPAVFMATGDLNKKGRAHLEQWGNLVRFEKLDD